jgi:hypothetical protein
LVVLAIFLENVSFLKKECQLRDAFSRLER